MTNWIQVKINTGRLLTRLPTTVQEMIQNEEEDQHLTLLYGCSNDTEYIMNVVRKYLPLKLRFGAVRTGDRVKEVLFVGIEENEALNNMFWELYKDNRINTDKVHGLIDGKFDPHLTIEYLYKGMKDSAEVKEVIGQKQQDFEVEVMIDDVDLLCDE